MQPEMTPRQRAVRKKARKAQKASRKTNRDVIARKKSHKR